MSGAAGSIREVASVVGGRRLEESPGGRLISTDPAHTGQTVAGVSLGDASTFVGACGVAREAQRRWGATPAPERAQVVK